MCKLLTRDPNHLGALEHVCEILSLRMTSDYFLMCCFPGLQQFSVLIYLVLYISTGYTKGYPAEEEVLGC